MSVDDGESKRLTASPLAHAEHTVTINPLFHQDAHKLATDTEIETCEGFGSDDEELPQTISSESTSTVDFGVVAPKLHAHAPTATISAVKPTKIIWSEPKNSKKSSPDTRVKSCIALFTLVTGVLVATVVLSASLLDRNRSDDSTAADRLLESPAIAEASDASAPTANPTAYPSVSSGVSSKSPVTGIPTAARSSAPTVFLTAPPSHATPNATFSPTVISSQSPSNGIASTSTTGSSIAPSADMNVTSTTAPTNSPTVMHTQLWVVRAQTVSPGLAKLSASGEQQLLHLKRTDLTSNTTLLAGRAYGGFQWESAPPLRTVFTCGATAEAAIPTAFYFTAEANLSESNCTVMIPSSSSEKWTIEVWDFANTTVSSQARAARLLLQGTFGPNRSMIDEIMLDHNNSAESWVASEMLKPATLHRSYYRKRVNPMYEQSQDQLTTVHVPAGVAHRVCAVGSRWVRYALSTWDVGRRISFETLTSTRQSLIINGVARTVVSLGWFGNIHAHSTWLICAVKNGVNSTVRVTNTSACPSSSRYVNRLPTIKNPEVSFLSPPLSRLALDSVDPARLANLTPPVKDTYLLTDSVQLSDLFCNSTANQGTLFGRVAGTYYRADVRLKTARNTLANPARSPLQTNDAFSTSSCPNVPKTFLNAASCVTGVASCAPMAFEPAQVILNESTLRLFYTHGQKLVYSVTGLRLEGNDSPCSGGISRWVRRNNVPCVNQLSSSLYAITAAVVGDALFDSRSRGNSNIRDINLRRNASCRHTSVVGASLIIDGVCWQHVHRSEYDVYDWTTWSYAHPGGATAITQFAGRGSTQLTFPSWHAMQRFTRYASSAWRIGRLGDAVDFSSLPATLQSDAVATIIGTRRVGGDSGFEVCGSPGEVANEPSLGAQYQLGTGNGKSEDHRNRQKLDHTAFSHVQYSRAAVWTNIALKSSDQLRQRVAWALSQIFVVNNDVAQSSMTERFLTYYDIFVRHAFGNYYDIMKEVSYSPTMATMLSFLNSKSVASSGYYPDENYAREIMQLFTIGLDLLNDNGTVVKDAEGRKIATYTIEDVQTLARAWTGFYTQSSRGNFEYRTNKREANTIDPMRLVPSYRDHFPKMIPGGRFLGDGYPLCSELPRRTFLFPGAKYTYLGTSAVPKHQIAHYKDNGFQRTVNLNINSSALAAFLCHSGGGSDGDACRFESEVTLHRRLPCDGQECRVDVPRVVRITNPYTNITIFYEYLQTPCVELAFFNNAVAIMSPVGFRYNRKPYPVCANRHTAAAQVSCCQNLSVSTSTTATCLTEFTGEFATYETAEARCAAQGLRMCNYTWVTSPSTAPKCSYNTAGYFWQSEDIKCTLQVEVAQDGAVGLVDKISDLRIRTRLTAGALSKFTVKWVNGSYPLVNGQQCTSDCVAVGSSCVCNVTVENSAVFTNVSTMPTRDQIVEQLMIGAFDPALLDAGVYTLCTSAVCRANRNVAVFNKGASPQFDLSRTTIFRVEPDVGSSQPRFFVNMRSDVRIGDTYAFRNPPSFHNRFEVLSTIRDAEYETDALLKFLLNHQSTPPFVAKLLIQRLVTSNPSPRYIAAVANAFKTGRYGQFGTSARGDLAATVAAILLDREARHIVIDNDPQVGKIREPLIKALHLLRALEYLPPGTRNGESEVFIVDRFGEFPWHAPSVFNFFQFDHQSKGAVQNADLVAPESSLLTSPRIVTLLNAFLSTTAFGLSYCDTGLTTNWPGVSCSRVYSSTDPGHFTRGNISLTFPSVATATSAQPVPTMASGVIRELDILLTGGRLSARSADVIERAYRRTNRVLDEAASLRNAASLLVTSAEFNTLSTNNVTHTVTDNSALNVIMRDYSCFSACDMLGQADRICDACGEQQKCCRYGHASANLFGDPDACNYQDGCSGRHCCVSQTATVFTAAPTSPPTQVRRPYKAIINLFLAGGCDSYNMLVPHSDCSGGGYAQYSQVRTNMAISLSSLHRINATVRSANSTQACSIYGVHPALGNLARLYRDRDALFVANAGPLAVPTTKTQFQEKSVRLPSRLFGHNTQQKQTKTLDTWDYQRRSGVLGRMADAVRENGTSCGLYSIAGMQVSLETASSQTYDIVGSTTVTQLAARQRHLLPDIVNMSNVVSSSVMADTWSKSIVSTLQRTTTIATALDDVVLATSWPSCLSGNSLSCKMRQAARLMVANRDSFHNERDAFVVTDGGYDIHANGINGLQQSFERVNGALADLEAELKAQGMWNDTLLIETSEFARTLTSNGLGTDHAWGGNIFLAGGGVKGGQILGKYPDDLSADGNLSIGRGRVIPTTSWDMVWNGVAGWFGVPDSEIDTVLPRRRYFPGNFESSDLFEAN